jgi:LEA14-like dessication related protein
MIRALQFTAFALLALFGTGCSALGVQKPSASIRSANIQNVTAEGLAVNFDLDVSNPNTVEIPLSKADYKLALGGVQVLDDSAKPEKSIPAKGSAPVTLPVRLNFKQLLQAQQAITKSGGNVPIAFDGALEFTAPGGMSLGGPIRVPVKYSGTLPIKDALQAVAKDPSVLANPDAMKLIQSILTKGLLDGILGK